MIDKLIIKEAIKRYSTYVNETAEKMVISWGMLSIHINGNSLTEILFRIVDLIGCPMVKPLETPMNYTVSLTCPYCAKGINIKVE